MLATAYYFLQVVICSGLMTAYYWLVLRNKRFHQYNRFYLLAITVLAWVVPLVKIELNHRTVTEDPQMMQLLMVLAENNTQIDAGISKTKPAWDNANIPVIIYFLVAAVLLFFMVKALIRLYVLLKNHSCKNVGDVYLILTTAKGTPFSFFRYIFWNEEIDLRCESGKQILQHEITHVQQKHSIDKIFMQLVLIAGWFNPFFWLIRKEMDMIHEFIADKKAVNNGDTASLAHMLLLAAYPQQKFALTNPFFSPIKRRLQMLGNTRNPRFSYIRRLVVLPLLAMLTVLFAFRNKEQRIDATISVASVMENVIQDLKPASTPITPPTITFSDTIVTRGGKVLKLDKNSTGTVTLRNLPDTAIERIRVNGKTPIIIVDGQRFDNLQLDLINPEKIASINILKDQSAIAKYGTEGANGVVEIITKKRPAGFDPGTLVATSLPIVRTIPDSVIEVVGRPVMPTLSGAVSGGTFVSNNGLTVKFPDTIMWTKDGTIPLIMIDGVRSSLGDVKPTDISKVEVLKNDRAIAKYGTAGKTGAIEITTYKSMEQVRPTITSVGTLSNLQAVPATGNITTLGNLVALTVTGKPMNSDPRGNISAITVKGAVAGGTYSGTLTTRNEPHVPEPNSVVSPVFPGGSAAWTSYITSNLDQSVAAKNGASAGRWAVPVNFEVSPDGTISNVKADNVSGSGLKEEASRAMKVEAERVIKAGPRWIPATYNGSVVKHIHRVWIIFVVPDQVTIAVTKKPVADTK